MGTMIVIYGRGASVGEFRTHITTEHKYLKYVFRDEYIVPDNLRLSSASAQTSPDRQTNGPTVAKNKKLESISTHTEQQHPQQ